MARYMLMFCKECQEESEIYCDGDSPHFCPECQSIDTLTCSDERSEEA